MIIDPGSPGFNKSSTTTSGGNRLNKPEAGAASAKPNESSTTSDSVSLSSKARTLGKLEQAVHQSADVDAAKVARVKQAVADGQYQPNSGSIAERMLSQDSIF